MSKNTPFKNLENSLYLQRNNISLELRDARQVPAVQAKTSLPLVAMYKDLSVDPKVQLDLKRQRQHLVIAFVAFFLLGFGMFLGSYFSKARGIAALPF